MTELTVCVQCMLEAMVRAKSLEVPETHYIFVEPPAVHRDRIHPNPAETESRRRTLLHILSDLAERA